MIQNTLDKALKYARSFIHEGNVATYIPELAKGDATQLGIYLVTKDGRCYHSGDWQQEFTMQSISKTISLIVALEFAGYEKVFSKVGVEPTGDAFNSIVKLETKNLHPLNPMINAGAIATASCYISSDDPFGNFLNHVRKFCGRDTIQLNEAVFISEKKAGMKNRSMAYLMQSENILECDAEDALDLYFKTCSVSVNTQDLANYAMVLANDGVNPQTGERLIENWIVRIVKTLMVTCGMYDGSGEFAMKVGIPAKSGVGGGIVAAVENTMGIGAFGPALDSKGNSIGSYRALEYLSYQLNLHCFSGSTCIIE